VRRRPSIRIQLLGLALAAITPVAGAVAYFVYDAARERRSQAEGEIRNLAEATAKDVAAALAESERLLSVLARRPLIRALDPGRCDPVVAEFAELHPVYSNIATRDRHGARVCSFLPRIAPASTAAKFPWFQEGLRSRGFIAGDASYGEASGRWFSALTYPLLDDRGEVVAQAKPVLAGDESLRVIDARNAFIMDSMMHDVVRYGTAARAMALGRRDLAGKTGTTNDYVDAWFSGYQATLVGIAWVGFDQPKKLGPGETGSVAALPIWINYMGKALKGTREMALRIPEGVVTAKVNENGLQSPDGRPEIFFRENVPPLQGPADPVQRTPEDVKNQLF